MREAVPPCASASRAMNPPSASLSARYLNGEFGSLETVDPHLSALLYAGDRLEAKAEIESALAAGKIVLADRYIGSNLAHQTERVPPEQRDEFLAWLKHLEYGLYGLPVEDLVVYLRVPAAEAHRLVGMKAARAYTSRCNAIFRKRTSPIWNKLRLIYDRLATEPNWARIDCTNACPALCIRLRKSIGQCFGSWNRASFPSAPAATVSCGRPL